MYETIRKTVEGFNNSFAPDPVTGKLNKDHILSFRTPDCRQSWGHTYFSSRTPGLDKEIDNETFFAEVQAFFDNVKSATWDVKDVIIDEQKRTAIVRIVCSMTPKGADEVVDNDMVFVLRMNESGEQIENLVEYVDADAVRRIFQLNNPIASVA